MITREVRAPERLTDPTRFDLGRLTAAERLFVWRHRQKSTNGCLLGRNGSAMNQSEAAQRLGIDIGAYSKLENGQQRTRLSADEVVGLLEALGPFELSIGELCFLARRRSGQMLMTLEREIGVSRPRFHELERVGDPVIIGFWEARGFRFPSVDF